MSMHQIELLLASFPHLNSFELHSRAQPDLIDGHRWEMISGHLRTLNFNLKIDLDHPEQVLNAYRSRFWIEEKRWFVAYHNRRLFSVSRFAETKANYDFLPPSHTTVPNNQCFYDHITECRVNRSLNTHSARFMNVETLELDTTIGWHTLSAAICLSQVKHLVLSTHIDRSYLHQLVRKMPNLQQLSLNNSIDDFFEETSGFRFEQIHTLNLPGHLKSIDMYFVECLGRQFPRIKHLYVNSEIDCEVLPRLIDRLSSLSNISFKYHPSSTNSSETQLSMVALGLQLENYNINMKRVPWMGRTSLESIHLWIGERVS